MRYSTSSFTPVSRLGALASSNDAAGIPTLSKADSLAVLKAISALTAYSEEKTSGEGIPYTLITVAPGDKIVGATAEQLKSPLATLFKQVLAGKRIAVKLADDPAAISKNKVVLLAAVGKGDAYAFLKKQSEPGAIIAEPAFLEIFVPYTRAENGVQTLTADGAQMYLDTIKNYVAIKQGTDQDGTIEYAFAPTSKDKNAPTALSVLQAAAANSGNTIAVPSIVADVKNPNGTQALIFVKPQKFVDSSASALAAGDMADAAALPNAAVLAYKPSADAGKGTDKKDEKKQASMVGPVLLIGGAAALAYLAFGKKQSY